MYGISVYELKKYNWKCSIEFKNVYQICDILPDTNANLQLDNWKYKLLNDLL